MTENTDYARIILNLVFKDADLPIMAVPSKVRDTEVVSIVPAGEPGAGFSARDIRRLANAFHEAGIDEFGPGKDRPHQDNRGVKLEQAAKDARAPVFMRLPNGIVMISPDPAMLSRMKPQIGDALRATFR